MKFSVDSKGNQFGCVELMGNVDYQTCAYTIKTHLQAAGLESTIRIKT